VTLQDWIDRYEAKAEPVHFDGWDVHFESDKGFLTSRVAGDVLFMGDCCGDFAWIHDYCMERARESGCKTLATFTKRNPVAFLRKAYSFGYDVHFDAGGSRFLANGLWYWLLTERVR